MKIRMMGRIAPVVVMVLVAAGCTDPTKDKTKAKVSDAIPVAEPAPASTPAPTPAPPTGGATEPTGATPPAAATAVYPLNGDNSSLGFEGYKVTGSHTGGFPTFDGKVTVPGGEIAKAQIELTIDMKATFSDDPALTKVLIGEKFFEVDKFPTAKFTSTSIAEVGIMYDVTGNLELHGVTKGITFPAEIKIENGALKATAEFTINRGEWNIKYPGIGDDIVRDDVLMFFEIDAKSGS